MSDFTVTMEYITPVSREYKVEILNKSDALYKNKLEYMLPFDTNLTKEAGKIEVKLTFTKVDLDPYGNAKQYVRKTSATAITIVPCAAWCDVIADSALTALDQRLIQMDAAIAAINDMNNYLDDTKADNIVFDRETSTLQLTANGTPIGDCCEVPVGDGHSCGIESFVVNANDEIIVTLTTGEVVNLGRVDGASGVTFTPHIDEQGILTWTNNGGLENPAPYDLNIHNDWVDDDDESSSPDYVWEDE